MESMPGMGLKPPRPEDLNFGKTFKKSVFKPTFLRPKEVFYNSGMPPVLNQGPYSTCNVHAGAALQYFFNKKRDGDSDLVSRRALYTQTKLSFEPDDVRDDGIFLVDMLKTMSTYGFVPEYFWLYPTDLNDTSQFNMFLNPVTGSLWNRQRLVKQWVNVPNDLESIKQALWQHGPCLTGHSIPKEWYTYNLPADGMLPIPSVQKNGGDHCMLLVGYSDVKQALLVRNSWGPTWAWGGYAWIPYAVGDTGSIPKQLTGWPYQVLAVASI